jgi:hypothetical protein
MGRLASDFCAFVGVADQASRFVLWMCFGEGVERIATDVSRASKPTERSLELAEELNPLAGSLHKYLGGHCHGPPSGEARG